MRIAAFVALGALVVTGCQSEMVSEPVAETQSTIETTPVAFNVAGSPTAELEVPDMHCQYGCAAKVKEVLASQNGVEDVKVDFDAKKAIVAIDTSKFDGEAAVAALVDVQFDNTKLLATEEN